VSTLFLLIRYAGFLTALSQAIGDSTFIPGPVKACYMIFILNGWAHTIFYIAADMVMILRVYAIYNRSKIILGFLLVLYFTEFVIVIVSASIYSDPTYVIASVSQFLDSTVCVFVFTTQTWNIASATIQSTLSTFLCILVVAKFVRESLQMHRMTRKWEINRYLNLLIRDGFVYFVITILYGLNVLAVLGVLPSGGYVRGVLQFVSLVPIFTLTPRFVINIRKLYVRDTQGLHIDTGFGLSSGVEHGGGDLTAITTILFVDGGATEGSEGGVEMVAMEERGEESGSKRGGTGSSIPLSECVGQYDMRLKEC